MLTKNLEETLNKFAEYVVSSAKTNLTKDVNKYERSRINRSACICHYGSFCQSCGFDFEKVYGELGKGFVHVHHIIPVSEMGANYVVNPIKDLIPLCPNCHSMIHKKNPPFTLKELKEIRHTTKPKLH